MVDIEKGTILHSAKMKLNFWSEYEKKLPVFASECMRKMPVPNYFAGVWTGNLSGDDFEDYYEITFGESSKCTVKITSINQFGIETVQKARGTYSCATDSFFGGKMFRLNVIFKEATLPHLRKIEWAYPISMNSSKKSCSINIYPDPNKDTLARLTLSKIE